ncbi:hypothetical protein [Rhodopseudomonas palustris]|nr:hypothetical protein [Rhodopseudomonas palustris]
MTFVKLICAAALASVVTTAPAAAGHKSRHHHHHVAGSLYSHNYGPPVWPGERFATYDGPLRALCKQGAAAYRGQDGRRHPCY